MIFSQASILLLSALVSLSWSFSSNPTTWQNTNWRDFISASEAEAVSEALVDSSHIYPPAHNISIPVDHFPESEAYAPHSNASFSLRYWFDAQYYKPGGPVFLLAAGETDGAGRLPFLRKGIIYQLAKATGGLGVILEHRYYGKSFPVSDLSVENLRFLDTQQALADTKYFAENIVFPGLEDHNLTAKDTSWITYGGSYAGAFSAFLRVLYPDTFYGAIASSGVTKAIIDFWEYYEVIRFFGPRDCIGFTQNLVELVDNILLDPEKHVLVPLLKQTLGFPNITHNTDFAATLTGYGVGEWQGRNWDPEVNEPNFERYCSKVVKDEILYPSTESVLPSVQKLIREAGISNAPKSFQTQLLNYIGWANTTLVQPCARRFSSQDSCFSTYNNAIYRRDGLDQSTWRSWIWQVCTQWGYFPTSNVPDNVRPIQSRLLDMEYSSKICKQAFDIETLPDVESINMYGAFDIEYERLAIVDGEADPWRPATPHAPQASERKSTISKPFIQIEGAVHHWDENGRFPNETTEELPPKPVKEAQRELVDAVKQWVEDYKQQRAERGEGDVSPHNQEL